MMAFFKHAPDGLGCLTHIGWPWRLRACALHLLDAGRFAYPGTQNKRYISSCLLFIVSALSLALRAPSFAYYPFSISTCSHRLSHTRDNDYDKVAWLLAELLALWRKCLSRPY